jgi:hypothetical protein
MLYDFSLGALALHGKFIAAGGTRFMEITGGELGSSISLDLSDIDVFNSDWVITWSCEFIDCCYD